MQMKGYYWQENPRLNNYKRDEGNGSRNLCEFLCQVRGGGVPAILRVHQPQYRFLRTIRSSGKYISISSEASLLQTHRQSAETRILDDFLIGFIPPSCHQSKQNKSI